MLTRHYYSISCIGFFQPAQVHRPIVKNSLSIFLPDMSNSIISSNVRRNRPTLPEYRQACVPYIHWMTTDFRAHFVSPFHFFITVFYQLSNLSSHYLSLNNMLRDGIAPHLLVEKKTIVSCSGSVRKHSAILFVVVIALSIKFFVPNSPPSLGESYLLRQVIWRSVRE